MKINLIFVGTGAGLACIAWTIAALAARDFSEPNRELAVEMFYSAAGESQRDYVDDNGQAVLQGGLVEQDVPEGTVYQGQLLYPFGESVDEADRSDREWTLESATAEWGLSGVDRAVWAAEGKQLFDWNCSACHGAAGDAMTAVNGAAGGQIKSLIDPQGDAMKRGDGWIYHVITYGKGNMRSHADKVQNLEDRWKIILHLRSLQGK